MLKNEKEIKLMHESGKLLANCHKEIALMVKPGITTLEIDHFVEHYLRNRGATPAQKGYKGYPYATCASINDEICHGFPRDEALQEGDIVTIDFVVNLNGALADSAWTYEVGTVSIEASRLLQVTKNALYKGIEQAIAGNRVGDIGYAIQTYVEAEKFSVVRDFTGHGIGKTIHEEPTIFHVGNLGEGTLLEEGMVITIEPMVNAGFYFAMLDDNSWTARTVDGSLSAQYEHTVAITQNGPLILTQQQ